MKIAIWISGIVAAVAIALSFAIPEDGAIRFNAALDAYGLGDYESAAEYYMACEDSRDKFLNLGNIGYRLGEATEDIEKKVECFLRALGIYQEGILKYPQDVPLKYNFEYVKKKLEELLTAAQEEKGEESEGGEGQSGEGEECEHGEQGECEQCEQAEGRQDESEAGEMSQSEDSDEAPDQDAIDRILEMLDAQERENLKNNQEVMRGKDGGNGW